MPYVSEFCLFAAAFVAAFAHGETAIERLRTGVRRLAAWRRKDRRAR